MCMFMQQKVTGNFIHKIESYVGVFSRWKPVVLLIKSNTMYVCRKTLVIVDIKPNNMYLYVVETKW